MNNKKYFAFISYKRGGKDEKVANWIHQKLEKYPYPVNLVKEENRPEDKELVRRIFIDTKELPVKVSGFTEDIKIAIENSRYLLVVCSTDSVNSVYVNREISYFLETHQNDASKILPIFIDSISCGLPKSLNNIDILSRNCPIYNSYINSKNEINLHCFYHIAAFLLKIDFQLLYNRYALYKQRKDRHNKLMKIVFYSAVCALFVALSFVVYVQSQLLEKQHHIVKLEKEIFPYSVVTGYVGNFLQPVVDYFKDNEPNARMYVHMPTESKDINNNHKDRFNIISKDIERILSADSIRFVRLNTKMPRGSLVHKIYTSTNKSPDIKYLDFASTTSTFLTIAQKKKENPAYQDENIDEMINEYTNIFIRQANDLLGPDSVYVTFVTRLSEVNNNNMH